ncbi:MAG: phosphoribosylglycinamide formyltransferase [Rhodospirillales bacterium]|nr:phosphoribosylglycinamide formyltransferase [Rhodospirillales bacterium]
MTRNLNLAVLISGRGSNLQALIDACAQDDFPARIAVVVSNRPGVEGLERAQRGGILTETLDHKSYPSREAFEEALHETLGKYPVDLICLAGFMRILTAGFVEKWPDRIVNIHPSLLPDYKGLDTHARAIADGRSEAGCTVHLVRPAVDDGPILVQRRVPILPGDTPGSLAVRVLEQEHIAYPQAIRLLAEK